MEWYTIKNADSLDTPALVIYPERVKRNIALLKTFVSDVDQLRPHIKTSKCPQVTRLMVEAGITRFKCATIAEAEMLAAEGAGDVLLAYQPAGPKAKRFCELQLKFPKTTFSCLIDNSTSLAALAAAAKQYELTLKVFIDLNVGMNRTGIVPGDSALSLYLAATGTKGIEILGLHAYDGHLRDADLSLRTRRCDEAFSPVTVLASKIREATGKAPVIVAGGTPTFPIHAKRKGVQASPGTFIFWDKGYEQILAEQRFEFAALVVTRVISKPDDETICLDLGHKSIASENPIAQRVFLLNAADLQPVGHSEEHMVFHAAKDHGFNVGDVLYGVPYHVCPTVALYEEAAVCRDNVVAETWPILARRRKISV